MSSSEGIKSPVGTGDSSLSDSFSLSAGNSSIYGLKSLSVTGPSSGSSGSCPSSPSSMSSLKTRSIHSATG